MFDPFTGTGTMRIDFIFTDPPYDRDGGYYCEWKNDDEADGFHWNRFSSARSKSSMAFLIFAQGIVI